MIGFILSANRITRLGFNPVTGSLLDRFGARWPVAVGLVVEAVGTLIFLVALHAGQPAVWFLLGRVVWGVGSSLLLVGALAAVLALASPSNRGRLTARARSALSLGMPAGLIIGGLVAGAISDDAAFMVATGLSIAGAFGAVFLLPDRAVLDQTKPQKRSYSATRRAGDWRSLFAIPTLRIIWAANALLFMVVSGLLLATVAVLVEQRHLYVLGFNAQGSSGLLMAVLTGARASTALAAGRYLDRAKTRTRFLLPAMALVAVGFIGLGQAYSVAAATIALLLIGAGAGGLTIPLLTLLGDTAPRHLYGRALSVYQWSGDLGGAVGPIAGLALGGAAGYGWTYAAAGLVVFGMAAPLRWLVRREGAEK